TMKAADISQRLIAHGRDAATPVAVISRGTRADQQVQIGTLEHLEHLAQRAPLVKDINGMDNPNQIELYTSGRASNEASYLYQLFGR
ncbi:hypothetical protein O5274_26760, partial [Escherichia coli]|nr:hypothetical protein [Escherichia coli]